MKRLKSFITFILSILIISSNVTISKANELNLSADFDKILGNVDEKDLNICGFKKLKSEFISDYQTNADTYEHIKTGAKVLVINNGDEEKFFTIGFKTPPVNNSGATHIFEHTTLQGSQKYPIKSMLTKLGSTSMATYFNAATADDFTFYPFGSLNEKDYYNLMNIYLDGIFNPSVLTDENVFKRDGIRIDFKEDKASYNGVVFNEMKNAESNLNSIIYNSIKQTLYPDTYYKYVSGGLPEDIVDLTYEKVIELHNEVYNPSNSFTVLYGDQALTKSLTVLNEYFKNYDKKENSVSIAYQQPFDKLEKYYTTYPVSENDNSSKSILALSYVIPENHSYEDVMTDIILIDLLMMGDTAPLKIAMAKSGITNSLGITTNYMQINQGAISFYTLNIDSKYEDIFVDVIEKTLKEVYDKGFDEAYLKSVFNSYEYNQVSAINGKSKGYNAGLSAISGWIYSDDPTRMMDNRAIFQKLKKNLNSQMFQDTLADLFLNNNYKGLTIINPDEQYQTKKAKILSDKLNLYTSNLTNEQISELQKQTTEFYKWQNTPDSEEALNSIPCLTIEDISTDKKQIEYSEPIDINGAKLIQTYIDTHDISNIVLSFDASTVPQSKLQYLKLLSVMWGNAATENYNKSQLKQYELNFFGEFDSNLDVMNSIDNRYFPRFNITLKSLNLNEQNALILANEIINNSILADKSLIRKVLQEFKLYYEQSLTELSVPTVSYLAEAMTSEQGKLKDFINGYEFYKFVCDTLNHLDRDFEKIVTQLEEAKALILNKNNLVIGYTGIKSNQTKFIKNISPLINNLSNKRNKLQNLKFKDYGEVVAIKTPSSTFSINQIGNLNDLGYDYKGDMAVLSTIISKGYLWDYIRERGGAYHTSFNINPNGNMRFLSYADPNFIETIKVYQNVPLFLSNLNNISQDSLNQYIINSAASIDNSLQDYNLWNYGFNKYITGYDLDIIYDYKAQILNTGIDNICDYSNMFNKLNERAKYIIVGNSEIIEKNKKMFDTIINIYNN